MSPLDTNWSCEDPERVSRQSVFVLGLGAYVYGREKRVVRYFQHSRRFRPVFVLSIWTDGSVGEFLDRHGFPHYKQFLGYFGRTTHRWTFYTLLRMPWTIVSLMGLYRKHHCCGVLIADIGTFGLTLPALLLIRLLWRSKIIFYVGDTPDITRANRLLGVIAGRSALPVIANSHSTRQRFEELGIPGSRIRVIHNGLAFHDFDKASSVNFRERNNWPRSGFIFGFVGQVIASKGVEDFVTAAERLLEEGLDVHFIIVGRFDAKLDLIATLRGRLMKWPGRFELCGDMRPIEGVYKGFDAVVVPSRLREPLPNVAIESMACGKPVIATRVGGIGEVVVDGVTGVLVPPMDPGALAAAMRQLAEKPYLAEKMGDAGRRRAQECFCIEQTAHSVDETLAAVFGEKATMCRELRGN